MKLLDVQHPFFIPLWRRVATVALCYFWMVVELVTGGPGWALLFAALGTYCAHQFFIAFDPPDPDGADGDDK